MKRILTLILSALCGCTTTTVETPLWSLHRSSFLQRLEIPEVSIGTNGTATLKGYKTDGGGDAAAAIAGTVAEKSIRALKK